MEKRCLTGDKLNNDVTKKEASDDYKPINPVDKVYGDDSATDQMWKRRLIHPTMKLHIC